MYIYIAVFEAKLKLDTNITSTGCGVKPLHPSCAILQWFASATRQGPDNFTGGSASPTALSLAYISLFI